MPPGERGDAVLDTPRPPSGPPVGSARQKHDSRQVLRRYGPLLAGAVAVGMLALVLGAVLDALALVVVGRALTLAGELGLHRRLVASFPKQQQAVRAELHPRLLLQDLLVLAFLLRSEQLSGGQEQVVVLAVVAHQVVRIGHSALRLAQDHLRERRAELRGLPGPGPLPPPAASLDETGSLVVSAAGGLQLVALLTAVLTGSFAAVVPTALATVLLALAVTVPAVPAVLAMRRQPRGEQLLRQVRQALVDHAPVVVLYSNGGVDDLHWVTPWQDTLDNLGRPALIMLRDPAVVDRLPPCSTPVVCIPLAGDVVRSCPPSARVGLYVASSGENLRLMRVPTMRSAFIGHGDSDKASSAHPASKMYDEVWVAGEAGKRRLLAADVGVVTERIRVVGRPQVRRVQRGRHDPSAATFTVLYAPTWEGTYGNAFESSLLHSGRDVVRTLLGMPGVRVLFRPHPATGKRDPALPRAVADVVAMLTSAGDSHGFVPAGTADLYDCFNAADALVADISGVVTDFLASEKPYVIVDGEDLPAEQFRRQNPSADGAYLVGPGARGLEEVITDARTTDTMRERRLRTRVELLGPSTDDPLGFFAAAVDALGATAPRH